MTNTTSGLESKVKVRNAYKYDCLDRQLTKERGRTDEGPPCVWVS